MLALSRILHLRERPSFPLVFNGWQWEWRGNRDPDLTSSSFLSGLITALISKSFLLITSISHRPKLKHREMAGLNIPILLWPGIETWTSVKVNTWQIGMRYLFLPHYQLFLFSWNRRRQVRAFCLYFILCDKVTSIFFGPSLLVRLTTGILLKIVADEQDMYDCPVYVTQYIIKCFAR